MNQRADFDCGQVVATPGALEAIRRNLVSAWEYLERHLSCDWGIVCEEDKKTNGEAVQTGARILSAYHLPDETILWIITDAEDDQGKRRATTFLLPDEY